MDRALIIGVGGGGDVVGALALARILERAGIGAEVGGVAWERLSIDPVPGPRRLTELAGIERLGETAGALTGPAGSTEGGVQLSEAGMSAHLGRPVALIDVNDGPAAIAGGISAAAERLDCDHIVLLDVGGDAIADGSEPGLASPLCDAVMLAAAAHLPAEGAPTVSCCVIGSGCDGELTIAEVLARVAALAKVGAWTGTLSPDAAIARELVSAAETIPTEASLQAARSALGELGPTPIRGGRRTVELSPVAGLAFLFDAHLALAAELPLAAAVVGAGTLLEANEVLSARGIGTELDYELRGGAKAPGANRPGAA